MKDTILIAEDETLLRELHQKRFQTFFKDYKLETYENGRQLKERLDGGTEGIALVFSDVDMPEMTGIEVTKHKYGIPFIFTTGREENKPDIESVGGTYLSKPCNLKQFQEAITKVLQTNQ